jgi:hypothetical protein
MPQLATIGARMSDVLSPTPPVECLSTTGTERSAKRNWSPESRMRAVRVSNSASVIPRNQTAIKKAAI